MCNCVATNANALFLILQTDLSSSSLSHSHARIDTINNSNFSMWICSTLDTMPVFCNIFAIQMCRALAARSAFRFFGFFYYFFFVQWMLSLCLRSANLNARREFRQVKTKKLRARLTFDGHFQSADYLIRTRLLFLNTFYFFSLRFREVLLASLIHWRGPWHFQRSTPRSVYISQSSFILRKAVWAVFWSFNSPIVTTLLSCVDTRFECVQSERNQQTLHIENPVLQYEYSST